MKFTLVSAAAVAALISGAAYAQTAPAPAAPAVAVPAPAVAAPAAAPAPATPAPVASVRPVIAQGDLIDTLKASGQFTILVRGLDTTNLTPVLKGNKNLTIFAPTDSAFMALGRDEVDRLMKSENAAELQRVLVYHVVNAPVDSAKIKGAKGPVKTVSGAELLLDGSSEMLKANSTPIVQPDVRTSNGILHVVTAVLSPTDPVIAAAKAEAAAAAAEASTIPAG